MRDPDTVYAYQAPWQSNQERLVSEALMYASTTTGEPPRFDPYDLVPPRFGYATEELTIMDILNGTMSRLQKGHAADAMPTDFSGTPAGIEGSPRNQAAPW